MEKKIAQDVTNEATANLLAIGNERHSFGTVYFFKDGSGLLAYGSSPAMLEPFNDADAARACLLELELVEIKKQMVTTNAILARARRLIDSVAYVAKEGDKEPVIEAIDNAIQLTKNFLQKRD